MKKRPTLSDVAREAGVSLMTVSRVINNKPGVSKEVRQKIFQIAADLDYQPNKIARSLATQKTAIVGLVVPSISNPFYAQMAEGIEALAFEKGYSVFLLNTAAELKREAAALDSLWAQNIDGAILCSSRLPQNKMLKGIERFPAVVLFNRELEKPLPNVVTICVNDQRAAQEAVQHFLEGGRRRVAYIGGPENSFSSQCRLEGYHAALDTRQVTYDSSLILHILPGIDSGREAAQVLLRRHPDLDAILAFNDLVAIGALRACQAAGKRVPEDIAIIGADDIPVSSLIRPQLSSSRVDLLQVGRLSMQALLQMLAGEASPAAYTIEPELILRESG